LPRLRRTLANLALAMVAFVAAAALAELLLRAFPRLLPAGSYGASRYDPELETNVHGSPSIYNRHRFVQREPNAEGFLDVVHEPAKPPGVLRVAFFGDSYVEAAQVPLDEVFFRRLPEWIAGRRIEPFGFGISGWGTLHALRAYQHLAPRYDLDVAIYVFVENDLGDSDLEINSTGSLRLTPQVFAALSPLPPGYEVVTQRPAESLSVSYHVAKWFQERLLLARLTWNRIALLLQRGVALEGDVRDREMSRRAGALPNQNDLPSTWPPLHARRVQELARRILLHWRDQARSAGRELVVLYVPRGEDQLRGAIQEGETWKPWLVSATGELGISLLDPSDALRRRSEAGAPVYDDHWTPEGHEVVAGEVARHLTRLLGRPVTGAGAPGG
jgi:hypothetical protein